LESLPELLTEVRERNLPVSLGSMVKVKETTPNNIHIVVVRLRMDARTIPLMNARDNQKSAVRYQRDCWGIAGEADGVCMTVSQSRSRFAR
jgi:hypothetical protein